MNSFLIITGKQKNIQEKKRTVTMEEQLYRSYSQYLKDKYHAKVYKLPVNLPGTCPNREGGSGCTFCSEKGTGFETMEGAVPVAVQLEKTKEYIQRRYHAEKFIAYFQNYTNTYFPFETFCSYIREAEKVKDIVEVSISTRPDCISSRYLAFLHEWMQETGIAVTIELGLQTVNYHSLAKVRRGHGLAEYIDAVQRIRQYPFDICTHVILNLPWDTGEDAAETAKILSVLGNDIVKIHSLYLAKGTELAGQYENGEFQICTLEEYLERLILFIRLLDPDMVIERFFSRIPEKDAVFCNWNTSWWKLKDMLLDEMKKRNVRQGDLYCYRNGPRLKKWN